MQEFCKRSALKQCFEGNILCNEDKHMSQSSPGCDVCGKQGNMIVDLRRGEPVKTRPFRWLKRRQIQIAGKTSL